MVRKPNNSLKTASYACFLTQCLLLALIACVALIWHGERSAWSVLAGGLAYALPNLVFTVNVFLNAFASAAKQFVIRFGIGESLKLFGSAILFIVLLKYLPLKVEPALLGYVVAIMSFWIMSMVFIARVERRGQ